MAGMWEGVQNARVFVPRTRSTAAVARSTRALLQRAIQHQPARLLQLAKQRLVYEVTIALHYFLLAASIPLIVCFLILADLLRWEESVQKATHSAVYAAQVT